MKDFILIKGAEDCDQIVHKIKADSRNVAIVKFAKYIWKHDDSFIENINTRNYCDSLFWGKYFRLSKNDKEYDEEDDFLNYHNDKKRFKNNLKRDFSEDVVNELYNFYTNQELFYDKENKDLFSRKAKVQMGKIRIKAWLSSGYIALYDVEEMKSLSIPVEF